MRIEKLYMESFMGKKDYTLELAPGVNILEGDNESGKTTVADFIRFMLYGASSKGIGGQLSERQRFLGFGESGFGGYMELAARGKHFRIDRKITAAANGFRESLQISDLASRTQVYKGENAGDVLLGVPETVFSRTAYITQADGAFSGGEELSAAIENLLFSADETVSTEKALKKLDALRVSLLHKNGKGGLLFDLAAEREETDARLRKALSDNSEIIAKEGSLADTLRRIETNKTEYSRTKKLCELYDTYIAHTRFEALDATERRLAELESEDAALLSRFDGFVPDGEYLGRLRQAAENVAAQDLRTASAERTLKLASDTRRAAEEAAGGKVDSSLADAARRASKSAKSARVLTVIGILLLLAGAFFAAAVYLFRLDLPLYAAAGGAALLGVLLLVFGAARRRGIGVLLRSFGASSADELAEKLRAAEESQTSAEAALAAAREREKSAEALLENERELLREKKDALTAFLAKIGGGDTAAAVALAEDYIRDAEKIRAERQSCESQKKRLTDETAAYDRATVKETLSAVNDLAVFETLDIAEYRRRCDFCEKAIEALEIKKSELEKSLAALHATVEEPALLCAALEALDKKYTAAKAKYDATELAIRAIANASEGLRTRVSPRLASYAGKLLDVVTGGSVGELGVDGELALTYMTAGGARSAEFMSKGTREAAYFALRLALLDLLYKEEKPPLILDECFAYIDDPRTERLMKLLRALAAEGVQSVVLACHSREGDIAERGGNVTRLRLS